MKPFRTRLSALVILPLLFAAVDARAQIPFGPDPRQARAFRDFPESDDLRTSLLDAAYLAPLDVARALKPATLSNDVGPWRLRTETKNGALYVLLLPKGDGTYPVWGKGAWIVKRSLGDGRVVQAKLFMGGDANAFLRFYPFADRSKLDVVLYGGVLRREVTLPVPIEKLLVSPLRDIVSWTLGTVEWSLFAPDPGLYAASRSMIASVRSRLPLFDYVEDGAFDGQGRPVFMSTGKPQPGRGGVNCSGFAKWLVDGVVKPTTGEWLELAPLLERHEDERGTGFTKPFETELDPYFGLDFTRNLALATSRARHPSAKPGVADNDVDIQPFALVVSDQDLLNGGKYSSYPIDFATDGYRVDGLEAALYVLAIREPGRWYLAAFNAVDKTTKARLRRFSHVAALFPYFDETGRFAVAVFESGAETSLRSVRTRYGQDFARLIRFPAEAEFDPPPLPPR